MIKEAIKEIIDHVKILTFYFIFIAYNKEVNFVYYYIVKNLVFLQVFFTFI